MLEREVQRRLVDFINDKVELPDEPRNPIRIYKELVHYRFVEVLKNAMPDFCDILGSKRLDTLIFDFIQSKPRSPFIWQVPSLFMNFLLDFNKVDDISFASDLMWFESIEVELLMGAYEEPQDDFFSWDENFSLSMSTRTKILNHAVNQDDYTYLEEHPLLMYYHFDEASVYFQEITPFMFIFLSDLENMLPSEALLSVCKRYQVQELAEVKNLLQSSLEEFVYLNILQRN
ncbi:putative DNA-binding domain-containing protein [Sulfurimonas sp. MAG313]|nr:putative DNA-binding domain-containing protein [Sulfurimonas sp. MAG313]MDF1881307.1 putative DNA-binding domain-containing protein [Sulfurimonas sp. MAG313]